MNSVGAENVDLVTLSMAELRSIAQENDIDIKGMRKKVDVITTIETYLNINKENSVAQEGDTAKLEEEAKMVENENMQDEMEAVETEETGVEVEEVVATEATKVDSKETAETEVWQLADGSECSKSAFIREQFEQFNKSRKDISEEYEIPYRTVYGATLNMVNAAEPTSRGRGATSHKIHVLEDEDKGVQPFIVKDGKYYLDGIEIEGADAELLKDSLVEVERDEWIREQVEAGAKRSDLADKLKTSYGVIYGASKELGSARQKHEVEYNGKKIARNEYIRIKYAEGMKKADIAKELGVDYAVVWSATKEEKSEQEKFTEAVDRILKFADKVADPEALKTLVEALRLVEVQEEEEEKKETPKTATEADKEASVEDAE